MDSEEVKALGHAVNDGLREGFENPPQTEEETCEMFERLADSRRIGLFPTYTEIHDRLMRAVRTEIRNHVGEEKGGNRVNGEGRDMEENKGGT